MAEYNLQLTQEAFRGGEARVHLLRWRQPPPAAGELQCPAVGPIHEGAHVAVKVRGGWRASWLARSGAGWLTTLVPAPAAGLPQG